MSARCGTSRESASKRSRSKGIPARRAMASRWITALVEPPSASTTLTAFSRLAGRRKREGRRSSQTISTMRRPTSLAMRAWAESAAGIEEAPGSENPIASTAAVMVLAVPIVMQVPKLRAIPSSSSCQALSGKRPARRSSQYFHTSEPEPSTSPRQKPRSMGPAGRKRAGRSTLSAPIRRAGVVLSQPPISTSPSRGSERAISSVSIAKRLR